MFVLVLLTFVLGISGQYSNERCMELADYFVENQSQLHTCEIDPLSMLFFLHVPRTAGRSLHSCFLKQAFPPSMRCARAYDHLHLDRNLPTCSILGSHDDFSIIDLLPEDTAVMTQLRDPVERVLSAYEFAIEVAARDLGRIQNSTFDQDAVSTRNVWPWNYLIPFFDQDISIRRKKVREETGSEAGPLNIWRKRWNPKTNETVYFNLQLNETKKELNDEELLLLEKPAPDPYNSSAVMPLEEFIYHPIARLLHNGATLQMLGLTNNTHWKHEQQDMVGCFQADLYTQNQFLQLAKKRLSWFIHTGIKEREAESLGVLLAELGLRWNLTAYKATMKDAVDYSEEIQPYMGATKKAQLLLQEIQRVREKINEVQNDIIRNKRRGKHGDQPKQLQQIDQYKQQISKMQQKLQDEGGEGTAARQVKPDNLYQSNDDLATAYHKCTFGAKKKSQGKREHSLRFLTTSSGEYVSFSSKYRKQVRPEVIAQIQRLNWLDIKMYDYANGLLDQDIERLTEYQIYEPLPPAPEKFDRAKQFDQTFLRPVLDPQTGAETGELREMKVTMDFPRVPSGGNQNLHKRISEQQHVEL